jgi:hypothetical protein
MDNCNNSSFGIYVTCAALFAGCAPYLTFVLTIAGYSHSVMGADMISVTPPLQSEVLAKLAIALRVQVKSTTRDVIVSTFHLEQPYRPGLSPQATPQSPVCSYCDSLANDVLVPGSVRAYR